VKRRAVRLVAAVLLAGCAEVKQGPDVFTEPQAEDFFILDEILVEDPAEEDQDEQDGQDDAWEPTPDADDPATDDPALDEATAEDALADPDEPEDAAVDPDVDPEPDLPWGEAVCATPGRINDCTMLCLTPVVYTVPLALSASLGNGKVMQVEIDIQDRFIFGEALPFDDLEVSLISPRGTKVTFWKRLYGGDSWDSAYDFITPWQMPYWWDEGFGGTWTLEVRDTMWTGTYTTLNTLCITPRNPADFSSVDPGAHVSGCATASGAITDYCSGDAPDPCQTHPIESEFQITDFVSASTAPSLTVSITHPAPSELTIVVRTPYGTDITVWDESPGSLPPSFALASHSGRWMTGRWALIVTDHSEGNTGTLTGWCVEAN